MKDLPILVWKKLNGKAIIPTKTNENIGYDIYGIFPPTGTCIAPHTTMMIPTGLAVAICNKDFTLCFDYALIAKDRGSTGSIGLHTHCGVIDAGYRGEIFIALCNTTDLPIYISPEVKKSSREEYRILYPMSKAIAQLMIVEDIKAASVEADNDELWSALCNTERGTGKLGSSQK